MRSPVPLVDKTGNDQAAGQRIPHTPEDQHIKRAMRTMRPLLRNQVGDPRIEARLPAFRG